MSRSIENMGTPALEVVELPTEKLIPDDLNPNRLTAGLMKALRQDIDERGFVQPIVVRPIGSGHFQIIDGEHRWRALRELKAETVSCVIDDAMPDEARMRMLSMNRLRGSFDGRKLGKLLVELADEIGEDELLERMGMAPEEHQEILALAAIPDLDAGLRDALERKEAAEPRVIRFRLSRRNAKAVERVIKKMTEDGKSRAEALIELLRTGVDA